MNSVMFENGEYVVISRITFDIVKKSLFSSCEQYISSDNSGYKSVDFAINECFRLDTQIFVLLELELISYEEYKEMSNRLKEKLKMIVSCI